MATQNLNSVLDNPVDKKQQSGTYPQLERLTKSCSFFRNTKKPEGCT
jgi:hypothetical protein